MKQIIFSSLKRSAGTTYMGDGVTYALALSVSVTVFFTGELQVNAQSITDDLILEDAESQTQENAPIDLQAQSNYPRYVLRGTTLSPNERSLTAQGSLQGAPTENVTEERVFTTPSPLFANDPASNSNDLLSENINSGQTNVIGQVVQIGIPTPSPLGLATTITQTEPIEVRDTSNAISQLSQRVRPALSHTQVLDPTVTSSTSSRSNIASAKLQDGVPRAEVTDPFAATGFRMGSWRANTSLEQTIGYSSNLTGTSISQPGAFSQTDFAVSLESDWSIHQARLDASSSYRTSIDSVEETIPTADVSGSVRLDLSDGVTATVGASYGYTTESLTSSNVNSAVIERPGVHNFNAYTELARTGGKLAFTLRGSVGRTAYEDAKLSGGGVIYQNDRYNNLYTLTGRVGYETSPALTPFVELEAGLRRYDHETDFNGDKRNSTIYAAKAGVEVDLGEKLTGEVSAGYRIENYDGDLEALDGLTFDGNLTWSPERDASVALTTSTSFSGSTSNGQNGSIINDSGLAISRNVNDRLMLTADAGLTLTRQHDGSRDDTSWNVGSGFRYWLNKYLALTGDVEYERLISTTNGVTYDATTFRSGIRVQR